MAVGPAAGGHAGGRWTGCRIGKKDTGPAETQHAPRHGAMIATLAGVEGDVPQEHVAPRPAPAADEPPPPQPEQWPEQQRRNAQLRRDLQLSAGQAALDLSSLDHATAAEELALTTARRARVAELESSVSLGPAEEGAAGSDAGVRPSATPQPMFSEPPWGDARRDVRSNSSWVDGLSRRGRAAGAKLASSRIGAPHSLPGAALTCRGA